MKRKTLLTLLMVTILALAWVQTGMAAWANPDLLVTPDQLEKNASRPDWVIVDCQELKDYAKGHIPGAISFGDRCKKALRDSTARVYHDASKYESLFSKAGIGNDTHVVFYHGNVDTLPDATVGFWIMEYLGHDKVHFLDGGIDAWRNAGKRLESTPVKRSPAAFTAKVSPTRYASTGEVLDIANGKAPATQLVDSRSEKENEGKDIRALRGGHVPHTLINVSHLDTLKKVKDPKTGKMKETEYLDPDAIAKKFASLDKNKRVVAYCQTGTRSTLTYLELRLMGFKDVANWDESWRVWGSDFAAYPVEAPNGIQYYNFDKTNKSISKLEKQVEALEASLKQLQGGAAK